MIRRKSDSFVTNEADMAQLIADVDKYSESKVRGFVFGLLTSDNKVDQKNVATLVKHAKDKYTVFSMAFDLIEDQFEAIDQLANLGVKRILTKGGSGVAMDNIHKLNKLKEYAKGKIELVVGGKVSDDNYLIINEKTGINQFQGRKLAAKS